MGVPVGCSLKFWPILDKVLYSFDNPCTMNRGAVVAIGVAIAGAAAAISKLLSSNKSKNKEKSRHMKAPRFTDPDYPTLESYINQPSDIEFSVALAKRLERDLRYILDVNESDLFSMIDSAHEKGLIPDNTKDLLHQFRMVRNKCVHGDGINISQDQRRKWVEAVISLEDSEE